MIRWPFAASGLFMCAIIGVAAASPDPIIVWNASPSVPVGLYVVDRSAHATRGDLVVVRPEPALARFLARRHYLPMGLPLLKRIAALPGERVCRFGTIITIDGEPRAIARTRDRAGRPLPIWTGCRPVRVHEIFLLNAVPDSLDGRYFGTTRRSRVIGKAHPVLTRTAPGQPLRWSWTRSNASTTQHEKEPSI